MAKAELRLSDHLRLEGQAAVEVWYAGEMIGAVYGFDGPGIRFITKYKVRTEQQDGAISTVVHVLVHR